MEVKSFLGEVNLYRKFIKSYSILAEPLILKTRGYKKQRNYSGPMNKSVLSLFIKRMLTEAPVLAFPDWKNMFWVECNTSFL